MTIKWFNVTCDNSRHIISAQKWLFEKYVGIEPIYLDVGNNPINNWGKKVASMLPDDEYIIFGLDDYLPIDKIDNSKLEQAIYLIKEFNLERFELSWGASKKKGFIENGFVLEYGAETPYKVSCQFSIWKTEALKRELERTTTPWKFEVYGNCKAACFIYPVLRYIEESAISGRQKGKINILGLKPSDVKELVELKYLNKDNLIYGWKGAAELPADKGGAKYDFNYC